MARPRSKGPHFRIYNTDFIVKLEYITRDGDVVPIDCATRVIMDITSHQRSIKIYARSFELDVLSDIGETLLVEENENKTVDSD